MYNTSANTKNIKTRILVVDNNPKSRIASQSLLLDWGYDPVLAMGTGSKLIADAKSKARDKCCILALIDMRLYDDDDNEDDSGLKLVGEFGDRIQCVILSGYGDQQILVKMIQDHKNLGFILKTSPPNSMKEVIDREACKVSAARRGLTFENSDILDEISHTALGSLTKEYPDQTADILARLFPNANKLRLEKMQTHELPSNIATAPRPTSIIFKVYEGEYEPYIVKIARAEKIRKEVDRYHQFIHRRFTERFTARLVQNVVLWDIGGAVYSYPGDFDVKTFSQYYREHPVADIEESLKSFFNDIWSRHYLKAYTRSDASLFELYTNVWGDWYEKCIKAFPLSKPLDISFATKELNAPDPIIWLKTKVVENSSRDTPLPNIRVGVTHGDLHGDNLLIDSKRTGWVIDFERCGEGHVLQDFIELETDILFRLEARNKNFPEFLKMFLFLLKHKVIQQFDNLEMSSLFDNTRIQKALQTISILRSLALQNTKIVDAREYVLGLLFNSIFRATIAHSKYPQKGQHHALMLASIICHRLDHWEEPWPPLEWEQLLD